MAACLSGGALGETGAELWVVEVLREGYAIPFRMPPPLSPTPIILDSYSPQSVKGRALDEEIQALRRKGAVEPAPPTPDFFSCMFVVTKATGSWRPIIDLSTLDLDVDRIPFRMETSQTVLRAVCRNDSFRSRSILRFAGISGSQPEGRPGSSGSSASVCPQLRRCSLV